MSNTYNGWGPSINSQDALPFVLRVLLDIMVEAVCNWVKTCEQSKANGGQQLIASLSETIALKPSRVLGLNQIRHILIFSQCNHYIFGSIDYHTLGLVLHHFCSQIPQLSLFSLKRDFLREIEACIVQVSDNSRTRAFHFWKVLLFFLLWGMSSQFAPAYSLKSNIICEHFDQTLVACFGANLSQFADQMGSKLR